MKFLPLYAALLTASPLVAMEIDASFLPQDTLYCSDVEVDYLLWYAYQDGMAFATHDTLNVSSTTSNDQRDQFLKTKWDSGVRASFKITPRNRTWGIRVVDNYFKTKHHQKTVSGTTLINGSGYVGTAVIPDYVPVEATVTVPQLGTTKIIRLGYAVDPSWKLNFNSLDFELGNDFVFDYQITFRPFFGVRGLWTNQNFQENILVQSTLDISGVLTQNFNSFVFTEHNKFSGVGAKAGFGIDYAIWRGLRVYGDLAAGILWGWFNVRQQVQNSLIVSSTLNSLFDEKFNHSHQSSVFNFDIRLGLSWDFLLNANHLLTFKFGWEQHLFTNMNQFQEFLQVISTTEGNVGNFNPNVLASRNVDRGDLTLSGFSFGLNYSF